MKNEAVGNIHGEPERMDMQMLSQENKNQQWGFVGTLLWGALITLTYMIVQSVTILIYAKVTYGEMSEDIMSKLDFDGVALSIAAVASFIVCGLMTCGVIKLKKNSNLKEYLAFKKVGRSEIIYWGIVILAFMVLSDALTLLLGKPIVPEFMSKTYSSTDQPLLLMLTLLVFSPVYEELFFRGFLFSGFSRTFIGSTGAITVTTLVWAAMHIQYDLYGIATIFITGLALGIARLKTRSVLLTIVLHSFMNLIGTIETIVYISL